MEDLLLEALHELLRLRLMASKRKYWIKGSKEKRMALISPVMEF